MVLFLNSPAKLTHILFFKFLIYCYLLIAMIDTSFYAIYILTLIYTDKSPQQKWKFLHEGHLCHSFETSPLISVTWVVPPSLSPMSLGKITILYLFQFASLIWRQAPWEQTLDLLLLAPVSPASRTLLYSQ